MNRKIITILIVLSFLTMMLNSVVLVQGQTIHPPELINVMVFVEYAVGTTEGWGQGIGITVIDPDGIDNLLDNGAVSIEILAPDGDLYPKTGDELFVFTNYETDPPNIHILWFNPLSQPPILGIYEITVTDNDGLSTTYITQPTQRVSTRVPSLSISSLIGNPSELIYAGGPLTFSWVSFSPETNGYRLELMGPGVDWAKEIVSGMSGAMGAIGGSGLRTFTVRYDGPRLDMGVTYNVYLFAYEHTRVAEIEFLRVTSIRNVQFTTYSNDVLIILLEDLKTAVDALEESDFRERLRIFDWEAFRDKTSNRIGVLIDLLTDDPAFSMLQVYRTMLAFRRVLARELKPSMLGIGLRRPHPVVRQCNDIVKLLRIRFGI